MLRDPDDEMVLETAANGRADRLLTFNERHFAGAPAWGDRGSSRSGMALMEARMTQSNYALRLQASIKKEAERLAKEEGTTLNQFINVAVARRGGGGGPALFFGGGGGGAVSRGPSRFSPPGGKNPPGGGENFRGGPGGAGLAPACPRSPRPDSVVGKLQSASCWRRGMDIRDGFVGSVGNTPLIKLRRASETTGCTILGKAEFLNPGGSVKDRAALAIIKDAEERGLLKPGGVIVEGTAGNTGIGLALVGNARGYRTVIVMPETQSQEKKDMLLLCGADLRLVPAVPYANPMHYARYSGTLAQEIAASRAERRDLGQPVRQPRQPARPLRDDRPRDLDPDRRQGRRLHLLGRHRRHLVRGRHRAQGAQPERENISVRPDGLGVLQLVHAP